MSDIQNYLDTKLRGLYEEIITASLIEKPKNFEMFMLNYLKKKNGDLLCDAEREELTQLRLQIDRQNKGVASASESEGSEEDEEVDELPVSAIKKTNNRTSVSAEAFGNWNQKTEYNPRVINKAQETKDKIVSRLEKSFMFAALDNAERAIVVNAMEERKFSPGAQVIKQGEDGDELFVVESGKLECSKLFPGEETSKVLKFYEAGEAFGELALLYNTPRQASIKAITESVCWVLDRECFTHIVKDAAIKRREQYDAFLSKVDLFKSMESYERSQLSECLRAVQFANGDYVIREGEWGNIFYIIEQGSAIATKVIRPGLPPETVKEYGVGGYFGELALIKGEPRAANILATSNLKCISLDRRSFKRLLGPIEDILKRNAEQYNLVISKLAS